MLRIFTLLLIALTIGLVGCNGESSPPLEGVTWVLESYGEEGNTKSALEDTEVTVLFESDGAKVGGSGGCNGYGSAYALDGNEISFTEPFILTMMYCNEPINDQENAYVDILQATESYEIKGGKLTITSGENVLIYTQQ